MIVSRNRTELITDGRFVGQAQDETRGIRIVRQQGSLWGTVGRLLKKAGGRVGFDPGHTTVGQHAETRKSAGPRVRWTGVSGLVESLRARKDDSELALMRNAARLADQVMQSAWKLLKPGIPELEVAAEIEYQMRQLGASGPSFETIVAFGERAALPHARPTAKRLRKNELVVLDLGAILAHYCSDITRTVFVGRAPAKVRRWYKAVLEAQSAAISAVRAGASCGEIDGAARRVLAGQKLDRYFVHSTGHGLGLEVHEAPRIARGQPQLLVPGNTITIEPGIYLPGIGGIRIEDDVAVHAGRTEVLTRAPRDLIEI